MKHKETRRNWRIYNRKLQSVARIEFWINDDVVGNWFYTGSRRPGGVVRYSDQVIQACHLVRTIFRLPLRQTQGFVQSLLDLLAKGLQAPDYTTLCRRLTTLAPALQSRCALLEEGCVIAIDSTGLSVLSSAAWHRRQQEQPRGIESWRKLHVAIDTQTGMIVSAEYSDARTNDSEKLPALLAPITQPIAGVCADMAYDTLLCRKSIAERGAKQLIPPRRDARLSKDNHHRKRHGQILKERDNAIAFIRQHTQDNDPSTGRKLWKQKSGYHQRSKIEATMWQIKAHTGDRLANRKETSRKQETLLKCKAVNQIHNAA